MAAVRAGLQPPLSLLLLALLLACATPVTPCSTIVVGSNASADGAVMCSHSNDGDGGRPTDVNEDHHVACPQHSPSATHSAPWPAGVLPCLRAHAPARPFPCPLPARTHAGDVAFNLERVPAADWPAGAMRNVTHGQVPQAPHTFAYWTKVGGYAAMNEHQVRRGEQRRPLASLAGGVLTRVRARCPRLGPPGRHL